MKNTKKLLTALAFIIIAFGTACNQQTSDTEVKSQVSESGEPRLVVQRVYSTDLDSSSGAFSTDGKLFAFSDGEIGEVTVFDLKTGKAIINFTGFTDYNSSNDLRNNSLGFSSDGKTIGYIGYEYEKSTKKEFVIIWFFDTHSGKINKMKLPSSKDWAKIAEDKKEFQKSLETTVFVKQPNGGIASGSSFDSLTTLFPDAQLLDEKERQIEIKKQMDKYVEENKNTPLLKFSSPLNISISNDRKYLEVVEETKIDTFDLLSGEKTKSVSNKIPTKTNSKEEIARSADGKLTAFQDKSGIQIKTIENGKENLIQTIKFDSKIILQGYFTTNGFFSFNKTIKNNTQTVLKNETQGENVINFDSEYKKYEPSRLADYPSELVASVSDNGKRFAYVFNNELSVNEIISGKKILSANLVTSFDENTLIKKQIKISPKGTFVAVNQTGQIFNVDEGREVYNTKTSFTYLEFSSDEKYFVYPNSVIDTTNWNKTDFTICGERDKNDRFYETLKFDEGSLSQNDDLCGDGFNHAQISSNGKFLVIAGSNSEDAYPFFIIWDKTENKLVRSLEIDSIVSPRSAFSPDNRFIAISDETKIKLQEIVSGKEITQFIGHSDIILRLQFSPDGKVLLSESQDNSAKIWDVTSGKELLQMVKLQNGDWIVTKPDGRFDTNNLDKVEGMHWIMPSEPLRPLPIEIFMRQYYEPKLLARVLKCNENKNCEQEFKSLPALNTLNRTQPTVKLAEVKTDSDGTVEVTVEVANAKSEGQKDTFGNPLESGVNDVRLLRDGQLVGYAPKTNQNEQTTWATWEWLKSFVVKSSESTNGKVELDQDGKATLKFSKIKLPKTGIDKVEFSAYAFNVDQIKSETSRQTYEYKASNVKGRAYIISMGVNSNEKQGSDLRFAANDARQTQEILGKRLREQGQYEEVVNIPLISDFTVAVNGNSVAAKDATVGQVKTGQKTVTENTATKAHFKAVLDVLAGRKGDAELLKTIQNADKLRQANPEDLIILSVSSHGSADKNGIFYLLASDANTISSDELSVWLRDVDGGELTMVIDACHSSSAVETAYFKPAPMNSRGLGQLSYDKGMRILTATQADNVALETNKTRQGLLSYALLQNGLNDFQADFKPQDRTIVMSEWLNFGVMRVPKLWDEAQSGQVKVVRETNDTAETETQQKQEKTQQPSLFDFSRKNKDVTLEKRSGSVPNTVIEAPKAVMPVPTPSSSPTINTQNFNGRVIKNDCRIRENPSTDTNIIGKLDYNAPINIGEKSGRWFRVTTATGLQGWMDGDLIEYIKK